MPRRLHPPGEGRQAVYRSGVHLTRDEFLAHAVPDSGRKTAAPDRPQQSFRVEQGAALLLPVSVPRYHHVQQMAENRLVVLWAGRKTLHRGRGALRGHRAEREYSIVARHTGILSGEIPGGY